MRRTLAWIGILAIVVVFAALVYCTVTGASANVIMAMIFCLILVPVLIYGLILFSKLNKTNNDSSNEDKKNQDNMSK